MKKILFTLSAAIGLTFSVSAQEAYPCHTDEKHQEFLESLTPAERQAYEADRIAYQQQLQNFIQAHPELATNSGARAVQYTIPVVFHIIHAGGPENISDAQIEDCIRIMNDDYQKLNADAANVQSEFLPIVADAEIEFKLAKRDPNGNCHNGITRTYSTLTYGGSGNDRVSVVQNEHGNWPGDEYLNVFVAGDIGGAAGYTFRPSNWVGSGMGNGIHVLHNYVGSIGTSSVGTSRTMTHEAGHWFDLPHTWGNSNNPGVSTNCNEDDGINDTPNTIGWTSCNLQGATCNSGKDNVENYMEYSYCSKMFTLGQKARMHAALNSSVGGRSNLHTTQNLNNTGVNEPETMCKANFGADQLVVCPGQAVTFTDYSYHGPTGWQWTFPGGMPSASTDQNPTIVYNTPGVYEVTLTATDGTISDSETKTAYIRVLDESVVLPFVEGFESYSSLSSSPWFVENPSGNGFIMENNIGHTGTKSVRLNNFGQPAGNVDNLISSPVDLSSITSEVTLSFRYAYRNRSSANEEWLRVFISNDCGANWAQRKTLKGANLGDITATSSWQPSSQDDWTTVHMSNVTSSYWTDNFRVRFEFEADGGNNFFLDDINIYSGSSANDPLSVYEEGAELTGFEVYPNPATDEANVVFHVKSLQAAKVEVLNAMGQVVNVMNIMAETGRNLVMLDTEGIQSGIYLVRVTTNGSQQVKRLVIR
ncbi:MAG: M43 family zinc metalloprotease [Brumimicrobium sp.]|nr:M43 family zinc metalloprotease [Brumimicrobium sp.]